MLALFLFSLSAHSPQQTCAAQQRASEAQRGSGVLVMEYSALRQGITLHNTPFGPSQTLLLKQDPVLSVSGRSVEELSPAVWQSVYRDLMLPTSTLDGTLPIAMHPFGQAQETWYIREDLGLQALSYEGLLVGSNILLDLHAAERVSPTPGCAGNPSEKVRSGAPYTVLAIQGSYAQIASMWDPEQAPLGWVPWHAEGRTRFNPVTDLEMEYLSPETPAAPYSSARLELASFCTGDPETLPFVTTGVLQPRPLCYLPVSSISHTHIQGSMSDQALWIDLLGLQEACSEKELDLASQARHTPKDLILRVPGGHPVRIEARPQLGHSQEGSEFVHEGWGPWTEIYTAKVPESGILRVPFTALAGATMAVDLRITAGPYTRSLLLHWPLFC